MFNRSSDGLAARVLIVQDISPQTSQTESHLTELQNLAQIYRYETTKRPNYEPYDLSLKLFYYYSIVGKNLLIFCAVKQFCRSPAGFK